MQKMMIATLFLAFAAGCEDEQPPKRVKAPEPPDKKAAPAVAVKEVRPQLPPPEETPKPPPPVEPAGKNPPSAPAAAKVLLDPSLPEWSQTAPAEFRVKFSTSKGDFTALVKREWAPQGADRFYCLVKNNYYDEVRFFRVVEGFMAQFGIHGAPEVNTAWKNATIPDDPVVESNKRGMISYAMRGPNTRTVQIFINYDDKNTRLDGMNFAPFAKVVEGMDVVDKLYKGFGEGPPRGAGPNQTRIQAEGNAYLNSDFKELDFVKTARILQ
jgi:peptidyl-prolyl cis-trans isomerase A (cyclophilin A)